MGGKQFVYKGSSADSENLSFSAEQIEFLEKPVRFSFKECSTKKDHCITSFAADKNILGALYKRLGQLELMTWQQARSMKHEKGVSIEAKDSKNHKELISEFSMFKTYGHFRVNVNSKPKFRVFGALENDLFYILQFDVNGKKNH